MKAVHKVECYVEGKVAEAETHLFSYLEIEICVIKWNTRKVYLIGKPEQILPIQEGDIIPREYRRKFSPISEELYKRMIQKHSRLDRKFSRGREDSTPMPVKEDSKNECVQG